MAGLQRISKNLGAALLGRALSILPQFVLPPLFAYRYSTAKFGEWGVLSGAVGALMILNFGVQTYMNQDLAVRYSRGEVEGAQQRQSTAIRLLAGICAVAAAVGLLVFLLPLDRWLHLDISCLAAQTTIYLLGLLTLLNIMFGYLVGIYLGVMMAHRGVMWANFNTLLMSLLLITGVLFKLSFPMLAALQLLSIAISTPIVLIDLKRKAPDLFPRINHWDSGVAREIIAPSGYFGLIGISTFLAYQMPLIVLQRIVGPVAVAAFIVMRTLFSVSRQILSMFTQAISTEITALYARRDNARLIKLYDLSERLIYFIIPLANTTMLMLSPVLISVWMGRRAGLFSAYPYVLAAAVSMVISLKEHKYQFQASTNTHVRLARVMFFSYLLMAPLSALAVHYFAVVGFLWVWLGIEALQMVQITLLNVELFAGIEKLEFGSLRRLIFICLACLGTSLFTLHRTRIWPIPVQLGIAAVFAIAVAAWAFPLFHMPAVFAEFRRRFRSRAPQTT